MWLTLQALASMRLRPLVFPTRGRARVLQASGGRPARDLLARQSLGRQGYPVVFALGRGEPPDVKRGLVARVDAAPNSDDVGSEVTAGRALCRSRRSWDPSAENGICRGAAPASTRSLSLSEKKSCVV